MEFTIEQVVALFAAFMLTFMAAAITVRSNLFYVIVFKVFPLLIAFMLGLSGFGVL